MVHVHGSIFYLNVTGNNDGNFHTCFHDAVIDYVLVKLPLSVFYNGIRLVQ